MIAFLMQGNQHHSLIPLSRKKCRKQDPLVFGFLLNIYFTSVPNYWWFDFFLTSNLITCLIRKNYTNIIKLSHS
jgi:hypothetical protein